MKHPTLGPFLAPLCVGFPRWQLILILGTMIMAALTIDVWLYYSKRVAPASLPTLVSSQQRKRTAWCGGRCKQLTATV